MLRRTQDVMEMLARKYAAPQYAFMAQVANGTGMNCDGYADALAMGLWPSRGLDLNGFEVKVSRGDWLSELKNPIKADAFVMLCDYWWVVAGNDDVVKLEEVPAPWGFQLCTGRGLRVVKSAPRRGKVPDLDRIMFAAIARRMTENSVPKMSIDLRIEQARNDGIERGKSSSKFDRENLQRQIDRFRKSIDDFETASGVRISEYEGGHIGEVFAMVHDFNRVQAHLYLERIENNLSSALESVRAARSTFAKKP